MFFDTSSHDSVSGTDSGTGRLPIICPLTHRCAVFVLVCSGSCHGIGSHAPHDGSAEISPTNLGESGGLKNRHGSGEDSRWRRATVKGRDIDRMTVDERCTVLKCPIGCST